MSLCPGVALPLRSSSCVHGPWSLFLQGLVTERVPSPVLFLLLPCDTLAVSGSCVVVSRCCWDANAPQGPGGGGELAQAPDTSVA